MSIAVAIVVIFTLRLTIIKKDNTRIDSVINNFKGREFTHRNAMSSSVSAPRPGHLTQQEVGDSGGG